MLLIGEVKSSGQPRLARDAINQVLRYTASFPNAYGVFVAPYISPQAAQICSDEGVGYVDLAGNCRLTFGHVFIQREGRLNRLAEKRDLRSLYSPRAARVLRVLLLDTVKKWRIKVLAAEAGVSLGQAHNVKKLLLDREWIGTGSSGVWLARPEELLSEWAANYDSRRTQARHFYSLKNANEIEYNLAEVYQAKGMRCALTAFSGAARYAPFVRYQRAVAYVDCLDDDVLEALGLKPVTSGANVSLLLPYDEGVYYGAQTFAGVPVVSPVQVYLDLQHAHGRGEEAAGKLLEEVIRPRWRQPE